jgi:hypothetical protein
MNGVDKMPGKQQPPTVTTDDLLFRLVLLPEEDRLRIINDLGRAILAAEALAAERRTLHPPFPLTSFENSSTNLLTSV